MKPGRNDPCPCGSGKKYKHCCETKAGPMSRHKSLVLVAGVVIIAGGIWFGNTLFFTDSGSSPQGTPPPGKVWSPEHGHYHDAPVGQLLADSAQTDTP